MAQFNSKPYASSCEIKQIALYKANEEKAYANILNMALFIQYHESILWPAYGATLVVVDNGENLISSMPITGFEKVVFGMYQPFSLSSVFYFVQSQLSLLFS